MKFVARKVTRSVIEDTQTASSRWRITLVACGVVFIALLALFWQTAQGMVYIWYNFETYTHGFLILPISLWLIWQKRKYLAAYTPQPSPGFLILVAGALFLWALSRLAGVQVLEQLAFVAIIITSLNSVLGWQVSRFLVFPLLFLFFAVPMGEDLVPPMMEFTATFTVEALKLTGIPVQDDGPKELFTEPTQVFAFENFTERIPQTSVSFNMVAIPGGSFQMGSPEDEALRKTDEGPVRSVTVSPFFMGEVEVSWDEYWTFYSQTMSEGRLAPEVVYANNASKVDAISGPTPPFGNPGQGWGSGDRPAITMSPYAAQTYCQWLSRETGKTYRLPTEAEWEYACRAGTETPYFFEGDPKRFSSGGLRNRIFGVDTTNINTYAAYAINSGGKTQEPSYVKSNPFGLRNMTGNVFEFCSDWYAPDAYTLTGLEVTNPKGPDTGTENVIRGGDYSSEAGDLRSASRASTDSEAWLKTDCQLPKSIWWYSDMKGIGFRVVCEPDSLIPISSLP